MTTSYLTIKNTSSHEINIQKSRFIGFIYRVTEEKEVTSIMQQIKKQHHQANHHCYAYVIGDNNQIQKSSDDGETSCTAGVTFLNVLKNNELKNTLLIVTRYFGGVKLGAGGLIRAYSKTASLAIKSANIVKCQWMEKVSLTIDYTLFGKVEHSLVSSGHLIEEIQYSENVTLNILVDSNLIDQLIIEMKNITSYQMSLQKLCGVYYEKELS